MSHDNSHVHHVKTEEEYHSLVGTEGKLVVVDYSAVWCGPCKKIAPAYASLSNKYTDVVFVHCDVDELPDLDDVKTVRGVPTFKYFKNKQLVAEFSGANADKLEDLIKKHSA